MLQENVLTWTGLLNHLWLIAMSLKQFTEFARTIFS